MFSAVAMRELIKNYDVWNERSDVFDHTVTVWKEGDIYYQLSHSARVGTFDLDSLPAPKPICMKLFMGHWCTSLTESPRPTPTDSFLKMPRILLPDDDNAEPARNDSDGWNHRAPGEDMVAEAEIYEVLNQHRHPNICAYYGCVRDGDYFTALCLLIRKYGRSLQDAIRNGDSTVDPDVVLEGISKGLHFLHNTLNLVHNDINPGNVMLDDDGNAVIIDFDSCMPIGQEIGLRKAGTFGWTVDPAPTISVPENDTYGLSLIAKVMERKDTDKLPLSAEVNVCSVFFNGVLDSLHPPNLGRANHRDGEGSEQGGKPARWVEHSWR